MHCPQCKTPNDPDAVFCIKCGKPFYKEAMTSPVKSRRPYLFMFMLLPALALVAGLGYYKFLLSDGERGPGPGCGGCTEAHDQTHHGKGMPKCGCVPTHGPTAGGQATVAADAGLKYWNVIHGPDEVSAQVKDSGCHLQVDIVKNKKIIGSLRYQNGSITEL